MTKKRGRGFLKRQFPQILAESLTILITAIVSFLLMTWLVQDIAKVENIYLAAVYEVLGTIVTMILILVSTNTNTYRKRMQEINTLANAIEQVANGDFHVQIPIRPNDPMAQIYADFNKMSAELASVQLLRNDFINNYSHEFKPPSRPSTDSPLSSCQKNCRKMNRGSILRSSATSPSVSPA
ncbi:MAG: HAMP domain-containing protein [Butyricicoccus sp.]|jgi:nitrogen fixation/metabolism regulation signal transduction histidine kinase